MFGPERDLINALEYIIDERVKAVIEDQLAVAIERSEEFDERVARVVEDYIRNNVVINSDVI